MHKKISKKLFYTLLASVIFGFSSLYASPDNISAIQDAGNDTSITVCATESALVLFDNLGGNPDPGGTWRDLDGTGAELNGIFNASIVSTGIPYRMQYILPTPAADTALLTITIAKGPNAGNNLYRQTCTGADSIDLFASNTGGPDAGGTWVDVDGSGALVGDIFFPNLATEGEYLFYYIAEGVLPCTNTDTSETRITVNTTPRSDYAVSDVDDCAGKNIPIRLSGSELGVTYTLYNEDGNKVTQTSGSGSFINLVVAQSYLPEGVSNFFVKASVGTSCEVDLPDTAIVTINPIPNPNIYGENFVCPFSTGNYYEVAYDSSLSYKWLLNGGNPIGADYYNSIVIDWEATNLGKIKVEVINTITGCSESDEMDIDIKDYEIPIVKFCPSDFNVEATFKDGLFFYEITNLDLDANFEDRCGNLQSISNDLNDKYTLRNEIIYVEETTTIPITWEAVDFSNNFATCEYDLNIIVKRTLKSPPNCFTPNGDGVNDVWVISQLRQLYPNAIVKVYDVSGKLVFESEKGYPEPWDGTYRGRPLGVDNYYYFIHYGDGYGVENGEIILIR